MVLCACFINGKGQRLFFILKRYPTHPLIHLRYNKTNQLSTDLQKFNMGTDQTFLTKLTKHIFSRYLDQYKEIEIAFLRNKCVMILMRYYDGKGECLS